MHTYLLSQIIQNYPLNSIRRSISIACETVQRSATLAIASTALAKPCLPTHDALAALKHQLNSSLFCITTGPINQVPHSLICAAPRLLSRVQDAWSTVRTMDGAGSELFQRGADRDIPHSAKGSVGRDGEGDARGSKRTTLSKPELCQGVWECLLVRQGRYLIKFRSNARE